MFFFVLLFGCSKKAENIKTIKIGVSESPIYLSDIVSSISYIELESCDECLIGDVDKILYYGGRFYILDRNVTKSLYVFDTLGKFNFKVHRVGVGPGEYVQPDDFVLDTLNQDIILVDAEQRKVIKYDLYNGNFKSEFSVEFLPYCLGFLKDGFVFYTNYVPSSFGSYNLIFTNFNLQAINFAFPFKLDENLPRIAPQTVFSSVGDSLIFIPPFQDTIYTIFNGRLKPQYFVDFGKLSIINLLKKRYQSSSFYEFARRFAFLKQSYLETQKLIYFAFIYDNFVFHTFVNKDDWSVKSSKTIINNIDKMPFGIPKCVFDNRIVGVVLPYQLSMVGDKFKFLQNPILAVYNIS